MISAKVWPDLSLNECQAAADKGVIDGDAKRRRQVRRIRAVEPEVATRLAKVGELAQQAR